MIHKVGLLPKDNHQQLPFAYKMYSRTDSVGWDQSNGFKKSFSVDVPIEFVGVWCVHHSYYYPRTGAAIAYHHKRDTVDSVGFIPKRLPFTTSNTIVRTFRHAVSLDERRAKFKMNLWNRPTEEEQKLALNVDVDHLNRIPNHFQEQQKHGEEGAKNPKHRHEQGSSSSPSSQPSKIQPRINGHDTKAHIQKSGLELDGEILVLDNAEDKAMNRFESIYSDRCDGPTNVDEVWFSGCHGGM